MGHFNIHMHVQLKSRSTPFCLEFERRSKEWNSLDKTRVTFCGDNVNIPQDQFESNKLVQDEVSADWDNGRLEWNRIAWNDIRIIHRPIIISLESPHEEEYSSEGFNPIAPLNSDQSRLNLQNNLRRLVLKVVDRTGISLVGLRHIILINPVQFQTSIHRLVSVNEKRHKGRLRSCIRTAIWKTLWYYQECATGCHPFQDDFLERMRRYGDPIFILNACSSCLKNDMASFYTKNNLPAYTVTHHPSVWNETTDIEFDDNPIH